ncbi:MAG: tRNA glutamyl-Q(34) synthetase GluQRS, partial [Rhizobacter sp.]|nr:tRNA glutamyl-Q(34) synthetase GluQRS [Burkholderiales bacterium]
MWCARWPATTGRWVSLTIRTPCSVCRKAAGNGPPSNCPNHVGFCPVYIGRFAPSPTGPLHFGSLVSAVASYADARAVNGRWLLRIEDVDTTRCTRGAETEILRQLAAYGFVADGDLVRQTECGDIYAAAITQLVAAQQVFACTCSRKMLETALRNAEGEPIYPGTCRNSERVVGAHSLRLRVQSHSVSQVAFADRAVGEIAQNVAEDVGDFVLRRADGCYAYQLAVVVDDARQGITDVVRGEDLLLNTPRQIYLQRLLGVATPSYLHVPLVRNAVGEKLSKQTLAQAINIDAPVAGLRAAWAFLKQDDV